MGQFGRPEFRLGRYGGLLLAGALLAACAAASPPKVIHEDEALSVRLMMDSRADRPHAHPIHLGGAQMVRILGGVRVLKAGSSSLENRPERKSEESPRQRELREGVPAFSRDEIRTMASHLIQALDAASPNQLVTFHLVSGQSGDPASRLVVTSGGLFIQDELVYFILANYRTKPFGDPLEGSIISEMDVRGDPLVPISPGGYAVGFSPSAAWVHAGDQGSGWRYMDQRKVVVIDLARLSAKGAE